MLYNRPIPGWFEQIAAKEARRGSLTMGHTQDRPILVDFPLSGRVDFDGRAYQDRHDHRAFLHRKVEAARLSSRAEQGRSDEAVEADFAARRARVTDQA